MMDVPTNDNNMRRIKFSKEVISTSSNELDTLSCAPSFHLEALLT